MGQLLLPQTPIQMITVQKIIAMEKVTENIMRVQTEGGFRALGKGKPSDFSPQVSKF